MTRWQGWIVSFSAALLAIVLAGPPLYSAVSSTIQHKEDAAHATGDVGTLLLGVRNDGISALAATDGDYIPLQTTDQGELVVALSSSGAAVTPSTVADEDASIAAGQSNISPVVTMPYYYNGSAWVRATGDPCFFTTKSTAVVDIVTATTTEVINIAGASNHVYVCAINLVTAGANNVALVDDDTDNCGSVTAGMAGGFGSAAEGWNLAANGGLTLGSGIGTVAKTNGTNRSVCLITSAAVQLSGTITYVVAP
jgi:hypothetical protein